jgi:hypothetical protein
LHNESGGRTTRPLVAQRATKRAKFWVLGQFHSVSRVMELWEVVYHVLEAKFMAESSPGVGAETTCQILDVAVNKLIEADLNKLHEKQEKRGMELGLLPPKGKNRTTLNQAVDHSGAGFDIQAVHSNSYTKAALACQRCLCGTLNKLRKKSPRRFLP